VVPLFPDFNFRSPTRYRIRVTGADASFLFGSERIADAEWHEYSSNEFRRITLRPVARTGLDNYRRYWHRFFKETTDFKGRVNTTLRRK